MTTLTAKTMLSYRRWPLQSLDAWLSYTSTAKCPNCQSALRYTEQEADALLIMSAGLNT